MAANNLRALFRPLRTGGPLNRINELYGLNRPELSVPIMRLVHCHKPLSERTLQALLRDHMHDSCNLCRCRVMHGGVSGWSERLYDVAKPSYPAVTRKECDDFVYDLFVRGPLRGRLMEEQALKQLQSMLPHFHFCYADDVNDIKYAVDIECRKDHKLLAGVQVKPLSFLKQKAAVDVNHQKNQKWGLPVFYLYYDQNGLFTKNSWVPLIEQLQKI
jgi:hypothetical protein